MYPDGKIRIWNVNDSNFGTSPPAHVLSLNTFHRRSLLSTRFSFHYDGFATRRISNQRFKSFGLKLEFSGEETSRRGG